jgi:hypothetical protein
MVESWRERFFREMREVHTAVDGLLASRASGTELRALYEEAAKLPWFNQTSYRWAPTLWRRLQADRTDKVMLRPFLLAHLDGSAMDRKGNWSSAWREAKAELEPWLGELDRADDVECYRRVLEWQLRDDWKNVDKRYRSMLLERVKSAKTPSEKQNALARFDFHATLDEPTALELYAAYGPASRTFILGRLPWRTEFWERLHGTALAQHDDETAWALYRRLAGGDRWARDVRTLITSVADGETLVSELEKRHLLHHQDAGPVFLELAQRRGVHALPYLQKHVRSIFPRWGFFGRKDGNALTELVRLADDSGWTPLWSRLLQSSATPALWNAEVKRLLEADVRTLTVQQKLHHLVGAGGEWNFSGFGFAQVQPLEDDVAVLMYERAPDLLRGPFRLHLGTNQVQRLDKLMKRLLAVNDETLLDYFASRAAMDRWAHATTVKQLTQHYEALSTTDGTFIRRATHALSMMPAFAIWQYSQLIERNELARLLFERSTALYLADGTLVRELLESPQIHVQALGFRVLATKDPRAPAIAASVSNLLAPTLLRPLHRRTRAMAFGAIESACLHDEAAGKALMGKMKLTLALPDKKYPKEELVGLMGRVLARWPSLRSAAEVPVVFRRESR